MTEESSEEIETFECPVGVFPSNTVAWLRDRETGRNSGSMNGSSVLDWLTECASRGCERLVNGLLTLLKLQGNNRDVVLRKPLLAAVNWGHTGIVKDLLDNGAYIHTQDNDGYTILMIASEHGHQEVVELLIKYLLERNELEFLDINNARMVALMNYHHEIAQFLLLTIATNFEYVQR